MEKLKVLYAEDDPLTVMEVAEQLEEGSVVHHQDLEILRRLLFQCLKARFHKRKSVVIRNYDRCLHSSNGTSSLYGSPIFSFFRSRSAKFDFLSVRFGL